MKVVCPDMEFVSGSLQTGVQAICTNGYVYFTVTVLEDCLGRQCFAVMSAKHCSNLHVLRADPPYLVVHNDKVILHPASAFLPKLV